MIKHKLLFFVLITTGLIVAQESDSAMQKTDELLKSLLNIANIPSVSIAISMDNNIVYANSLGLSDIENNIEAGVNTKYRIGSVVKLFTAAAAVKLIEKNILNKNDPVTSYIKNLPSVYEQITIAQLAGHLAGIRHYTRDEIFSRDTIEYSDLEEALSVFINDSLISVPGEKFNYSSYGYILLGAILENATAKKFTDIINENILDKSGMRSTTPEFYGETIEGKSRFYHRTKEGSLVIAESENYSYKFPAAGYLSTAVDLAMFGSSLLSGKIVDEEYLTLLFDKQKTNSGKEINSGFGFRIGKDGRDRKVVHHGGDSEGGRAFLLIYPESELVIALTANVFRAPLYEGEAETIAGYFLNDFENPEHTLTGTIKFSTMYNEKPIDGKIDFDAKTISGFTDIDIPIVDIVKDGGKIRLIAVSTSGIINFWISKMNGNYTGKWGYDKETTEIKFE